MPSTVVLIDASEVDSFLRLLGRRAANLRPTMGVVAESLLFHVDENLETSGHGTWPPLAPSTLKQKARKGWTSKPLFATGAMAAANATEHGDDFAEVTNSRSYTKFHVSNQPRSKIPLRDFFDVPPEAYEEAAQIIAKAIVSGK
jgi:phage gpG-like protein